MIIPGEKINELLRSIDELVTDFENGLPLYNDGMAAQLREIVREWARDVMRESEVDQLRAQLVCCAVAAQGGIQEGILVSPKYYSWSPAYQDVVRYEDLKKVVDLMGIKAYQDVVRYEDLKKVVDLMGIKEKPGS